MIKKSSKFLSAMLSVCMTFGTVPAVFAADGSTAGSDIDGHWAEAALEEFISDGYLNGDGSGNYQPDNSMTRAQYAAIINRVLSYSTESTEISNYTDVSASAWYRADLAKALAAGYMTGTSSTTMSPETAITREQAFAMIARILDLDTTTDTSALNAFNDASDVSDWAKQSVAAMIDKGYVSGDNNKNINPQKELTRAEGVTVLNRIKSVLTGGTTSAGTYKDGVYTGTGAGYGGTMTLQVTVKDGKISAIDILSESETSSYLTRAKTIIQEIIDNNGTDGVDAVSGATKSSNGILDAVNACLSQAKGGSDTSTTGSTGGGGGGGGSVTEPSNDDPTGRWADGTYTGTAQGYSRAGVTATVTVADGEITDITLINNGETTSYFNKAMGATKSGQTIIEEIKGTQSTNNIDTVSGATRSSKAIINAIKAALQQASDAVTEAYTFEVSNWAELTEAVDDAADGDIIKLTGDITDAGEDYTITVKDDSSEASAHALAESESDTSDDYTFPASRVDAVTSATYGMLTLSKNLTIEGDGHTITNSDNAENLIFTFNISGQITMNDLTIDGAEYGKKMGGGLYVAASGASLMMNNVTVKNCKSYKSSMPGNGGAGVWIKNGSLTAEGCTFENNEVVNQGYGGAVMVSNSSTATLKNCTFTNNTAYYGGAIAAYGTSALTVKDSTFSENTSKNGGNDIYIFDGATQGKSGFYSDSSVSYTLTGNTYGNYTGTDYKAYAVMMGRYYASITTTGRDGTETTKEYVGSGTDSIFAPGYDVTFSDADRTEVEKTVNAAEEYDFLMMDIPYADFYAAETGSNTVKVDAMTSATKSKTRTATLAGGSYHVNSDGTDITGITYPVLVKKGTDYASLNGKEVTDDTSFDITTTNRGQTSTTTFKGVDALFEQPSYSYYVLSEAPAYYKVLTMENGKASFGAVQGGVTTISDADASFTTDSSYGDYELDFSGITEFEFGTDTIYGVLVKTTDGCGYGMRHVENIWRGTELAWCTGFTSVVHNCPTSSDHYISMMGETINEVVYYTSAGTFSIAIDDIYVPVKFNYTFEVADCESETSTTVTADGFPEAYSAVYTVTDSQGVDVTSSYGFSVSGSTLSWKGAPLAGEYTLTASDGNGKYADVSASFIISTTAQAAAYSDDEKALVKADGASDEEFANYLGNISAVSVDGTSYKASGKSATQIIDPETGVIDLTAQSNKTNIFEQGKSYEMSVTATGYSTPLEFTLSVGRYITMNVPYTDFYDAYDLTDSAVWEVEDGIDAVSTATASKFKGTTGLAKGTYNNGEYIMGVTIPVEVSSEDYAKLSTSLGESDAYYFTALDAIPEASTKLTIGSDGSYSFGTMSAAADEYASELSVSEDTLTLVGGYGDYQFDITGYNTYMPDAESKTADQNIGGIEATLYGVILKTGDDKSYGMTCLENNWVGMKVDNIQVAWSIKEGQGLCRAHGSGDPFYQFEGMNGATLTGVTVITSVGVIDIDCNIELPEYYAGDLSSLTYSISSDSDQLSISGIPSDLKNVEITLSYKDGRNTSYLAENASVSNGKVQLTAAPQDGVSYTLTINSSNFPGINKTVATSVSDAQIAELESLISKAKAANGYNSNSDLKEHVGEAEEMIAEKTADSAEASTLIEELEEKIKATYDKLKLSASLVGNTLTVTLPDGVELSSLGNAEYSLTSGSGKSSKTIASGTLSSLTLTVADDSVPAEGTVCTLSVTCDNYQDSSCSVTAEAAAATASAAEEEAEEAEGENTADEAAASEA